MPNMAHTIRIAQNGSNPAQFQGDAGAVANTGRMANQVTQPVGKKPYELGEIPNPGLLFGNALLVVILMIVFVRAATRKMEAIPSGVQNLGEFIVEALNNFTCGIIGPDGSKYTPLVGTLFLYIFLSNLIGEIPGFHSPTSNLTTTLALGLIVFFYVQYVGIRNNGLIGYIKHFMGPMPLLSPLLFPIEVISEIVKPFTLALRLFGNIFGEDTAIAVLATMGITMLPKPLLLPLQFPVLVLDLLVYFVQALVFALLTATYLSMQQPHHESNHDSQEISTQPAH